jgi:hypothetical protein
MNISWAEHSTAACNAAITLNCMTSIANFTTQLPASALNYTGGIHQVKISVSITQNN